MLGELSEGTAMLPFFSPEKEPEEEPEPQSETKTETEHLSTSLYV